MTAKSGSTGLEYAPRGLIGALTPQANTTVEPEFQILLPEGYGMINARMTSPKNTINARLLDYWATLDQTLDQFANAPVSAVAFGCTGASYLAGRYEEDMLVARIGEARGYPFVTSAIAVTDALNALDAKRVGLVSPYHADLTDASIRYWESRGFEIVETSSTFNADSDFHPIYSLQASSAYEALLLLRDKPLDAIVMLGTGMPTLAPIASVGDRDGPPVMSCMLCLAWRTIQAIDGKAPEAGELMSWLKGSDWANRL